MPITHESSSLKEKNIIIFLYISPLIMYIHLDKWLVLFATFIGNYYIWTLRLPSIILWQKSVSMEISWQLISVNYLNLLLISNYLFILVKINMMTFYQIKGKILYDVLSISVYVVLKWKKTVLFHLMIATIGNNIIKSNKIKDK